MSLIDHVLLGAAFAPPNKGRGSTVTPPPIKQGPVKPPKDPVTPPAGSTPAQKKAAQDAKARATKSGNAVMAKAKAALKKNPKNPKALAAQKAAQAALAAAAKVTIVGDVIGDGLPVDYHGPAAGTAVLSTNIQAMLVATFDANAAANAADEAGNMITDSSGASIYPSSLALTTGGAGQQVMLFVNGVRLVTGTSWATSAPGVASVDSSGNVTPMGAGTAAITGTNAGNTATVTVNVTQVPFASTGGSSFSDPSSSYSDDSGGAVEYYDAQPDEETDAMLLPSDQNQEPATMDPSELLGFDWMEIAKGATGALSNFGGGGGAKGGGDVEAALARQRLEAEKKAAEEKAASMKLYLVVGVVAAGVVGYFVFVRKK